MGANIIPTNTRTNTAETSIHFFVFILSSFRSIYHALAVCPQAEVCYCLIINISSNCEDVMEVWTVVSKFPRQVQIALLDKAIGFCYFSVTTSKIAVWVLGRINSFPPITL
jgi:hypothetical protein